jgi:hypothetical protein
MFDQVLHIQQHKEHRAWLAAMRELKQIGIDINEQDQFHAAITLWGEELADLRSLLSGEIRKKAYEEARARYCEKIGFPPY